MWDVVVHGPPRLHLDTSGVQRVGCPFLAQEIGRVRLGLVVFGHIHVGYGREDDMVLDGVQQCYEEIVTSLAGWWALGTRMLGGVALAWIRHGLSLLTHPVMGEQGLTTFVNATVVGAGLKNELRNPSV